MSGAMTVTTNLNALNTQRSLSNSNSMLSKSLEKLSSGYRINTAADDPSGLIISEQLRTQVEGLSRASQNSQEACNVIGIAEGALIEMNDILTKMRALAIHAANNGVTAPDQVAADQAEVDSGIQTIERIASTTKYSDQFLLNGSKGIVFDTKTTVDNTMNHALLNVDATRIDQVFKREGSALSITFSGLNDATTLTQAEYENQARRAYMEADKTQNALTEIEKGVLTGDQSFVLTGSLGSRQFTFAKGIEIGTVVSSINNVKDSIGIGATMIFNSDVTGVEVTTNGSSSLAPYSTDGNTYFSSGDVGIFNLNRDFEPKGFTDGSAGIDFTNGVASVTFSTTGNGTTENSLTPGVNLDANGRMYLKWLDEDNYVAYKDADLTMEVGRGTDGQIMTSMNNSGVDKANLLIDVNEGAGAPSLDDVTILEFGQHIELNSEYIARQNAVDMTQLQSIVDNLGLVTDDPTASETSTTGASAISGVDLGVNTDANGKLYFEVVTDENDPNVVTINLYKDATMDDEFLVATGYGTIPGTDGDANTMASIPIFGVKMDDGTGPNSGLYGNLTFQGGLAFAPNANTAYTGTLAFDDVGIRLYTMEYGSNEYLRFQNIEGSLFGSYKNGENDKLELVAEGNTKQLYGGDALIYVNGQQIQTQGLVANVTTPNYSGELVFNSGKIGETTIAQVGQDVGSLCTRGGSLQAVASTSAATIYDPFDPAYRTWVTNARHATTETIGNFVGGMQYQLGEGSGDQERTVYAIPSMSATNLGKCVIDGESYTLQDVLAGGTASLTNDPIAAMEIILQAVNDVTELRARLGAFQSNMLETNINSLGVTVENIQKTESAIRDTDMASASTEYTKNQILVQAGTSMLAQANQINQNILSLLGG